MRCSGWLAIVWLVLVGLVLGAGLGDVRSVAEVERRSMSQPGATSATLADAPPVGSSTGPAAEGAPVRPDDGAGLGRAHLACEESDEESDWVGPRVAPGNRKVCARSRVDRRHEHDPPVSLRGVEVPPPRG